MSLLLPRSRPWYFFHRESRPPRDEMVGSKKIRSDKKEKYDGEAAAAAAASGLVAPCHQRSLVEDLKYRESPFSLNATKHVVIVMDAMEEFSMETLEWALLHVIKPGYAVTLLGVMPWLNVPLSGKTWLDIWKINLEGLLALKEWSDWTKNETKYQKIQRIIELCDKYRVVPYMKVAMGYPLKLVVLEQTTILNATWVVFDRHHQKDKEFYAARIPSNVMMMNNEGDVEMLKARPMIKEGETTTPEASPTSRTLIAKVIISDSWKRLLKNKEWNWSFQ